MSESWRSFSYKQRKLDEQIRAQLSPSNTYSDFWKQSGGEKGPRLACGLDDKTQRTKSPPVLKVSITEPTRDIEQLKFSEARPNAPLPGTVDRSAGSGK